MTAQRGLLLTATIIAIVAPGAAFAAALSAAILPDTRSAVVGEPVSVFATIAALGDAEECAIRPLTVVPADFVYQTTSPTTNALTGTANTPADIADGQTQSFVISFTPTSTFEQTAVELEFDCANSPPAPISGVNTLLLSGSATPVPDVVAIASVASNDGIVALTADGTTAAFAVAALNIGAEASIAVDVQPGAQGDRVNVFACQTNAAGACVTPSVPAVLPLVVPLGAAPATFSFFVNTEDWVRFDPGNNRLKVQFLDTSDVSRGGTSLAVIANPTDPLDVELIDEILDQELTGDPTTGRDLPSITDPLPQLGKLLFFSKSLGGVQDTACASCHHPALGGADGLSFPIGTDATDPDVMGIGRRHSSGAPIVGRNSPTVFNTGLYDRGLFWDSRVESLGQEPGQGGAASGIRTPDSALGVADPNAGPNLLAAQARFPVTVPEEMRDTFDQSGTNATVRDHLAARVGDYGSGAGVLASNDWLPRFQQAFNSTADARTLITFDNIALAIGDYQRSMVFVETPWKRYVEGDLQAISETAKRGALVFFQDIDEGGADCARCHSGDFFTDEEHHVIAPPQIGPGKGDGNVDDFGRMRETGDADDRYFFRTPSLLNIDKTAPYFHSGAYDSLRDVVRQYAIPLMHLSEYFQDRAWCDLPQYAIIASCRTRFPNAEVNTDNAFSRSQALRTSDPDATFPDLSDLPSIIEPRLAVFMETLTDPCIEDRACLAPWIPEPAEAPDGNQLNARDRDGNAL